MADNFAVVTFDDGGPIKTWPKLAAVAAHNNRDQVELHCDPAGPKPQHLSGTPDLVANVKARLLAHGIDPASLRKNANIAFEVVMTASHAFFAAGTEDERLQRLGGWIRAACGFARKMWGNDRIVSMVLHLDEHTPHIHVVLLPLLRKAFKRWPERGETWTLVGRTICGPGRFQQVQTAYAEATAPLGLVRGVSRSRAKYRPYGQELAALDELKARAAAATADAERVAAQAREDDARAKARWADDFNRLEAWKADLAARETKIKEDERAAQRVAADNRATMLRLELDERKMRKANAAIDRDQSAAAAYSCSAATNLDILTGALNALDPTIDHALAFRAALLTLPLDELPPEAIDVLRSIRDFERAAELVDLPAAQRAVLPLDVQRGFTKVVEAVR